MKKMCLRAVMGYGKIVVEATILFPKLGFEKRLSEKFCFGCVHVGRS